MGIQASIYDSSHGRDSLSVFPQNCEQVTVVNADGPFEPSADRPAVKIVLAPGGRGCPRVVPLYPNGEIMHGVMKGYSFVASSDSRFSTAVEQVTGLPFYGAVALHDRFEG